ncbi:MAG: phage head-tail connector protein, partial [Armatimonadota bacterium]|nr:phage head-tail connector protein [Armatimonadota bacterium]
MTAYATLAEARTHGGITDSSRDADLSRLLLAASRAIDRAIGIPDGAFIASSPSSVSVFLDRPRRSLVLENFLYQVIGVFYSPDGSAANEVDETDQIVPAAARLGAQPPFRVLVRRDG